MFFTRFFKKFRSTNSILFAILMLSVLIPISQINLASAATNLTQKWVGYVAGGGEALLTADAIPGTPGEEIFHAGGPVAPSSGGRVTCLNGRTGAQIWTRTIANVGDTCQIHMVDMDNNGDLELVVPLQQPAGVYILHAENGNIMFSATSLGGGRIDSSPVSGDVDNDGYPDLFIGVMAYEEQPSTGKIIHYEWNPAANSIVERNRVQVWHPCAGGLSLGDTDNDGTIELYMNERDVYFGDGAWGRGTVSFWAENLTVRWQLYGWGASSNIPMLADVDKDGIVDVVTTDLSAGVCVLNSTDGRPLKNAAGTTLYQTGISGRHNHYQSSIYDIDGDGNLEILSGDGFEGEFDYISIWDLYSWSLDGSIDTTLVGGRSWKGPTVGEITGDGVMDIIVTTFDHIGNSNNGTVQVYDRNYNLIYVNTGLVHRALDSVVQDVDRNDGGLNELLVLTQGGVIYCFETPGIASNPRARSEIQFYSESRNGASENIPFDRPWPDVSSPNPAPGAFNVSTSLSQLSFRLNHPLGQTMSYTVTTTPSIGSGSGTNVGNGVKTVSVSGLTSGTMYRWQVVVTDQAGHRTTQNYWFYTAPYYTNTPPTHGTPLLSGSSVQASLVCQNQSTADINGDKITNIYNWYKNGASITNLNLPFETQPNADDLYSGTATTRDYSGRNNNGAVFGATYTQGVVGGGYYFGGKDFITVNEQSNSLGGSGTWMEMSIEFWIKAPTAASSAQRLIWKPDRYDTRNINSYRVDVRNNNLQQVEFTWYVYSGTSTYSIGYNVTSGVADWHHVVCTYKSGSGMKIYVDGSQQANNASSAITGAVNGTSGPLQIAFNRGRDFVGYLDEVRIYPYEITSALVNQRYQETRSGQSSSSTISPSELSVGQQWQCRVTPNDGKADGTTRNSNTVTVTSGPSTQYLLTINTQGAGSTNPSTGAYLYSSDSIVEVTAIAGPNYQFSHWLRNGTNYGSDNPCPITMNANYILTAVFIENPSGHLFADDFEIGNLAAWDGQDGTTAISTTSPHQGTYHLSCSLSSGANNVWSGAYKSITGNNPVHLSAYVRFNAPPNTDSEDQWALAFTQNTAGNALAYAGIRQVSGTLYWTIWHISSGTTLTYQVSSTPYTSGWHNLQLAVYRGTANDGWVEFYVDGALVCSAHNLDNDGRTVSYARVGFSYSDAPSAATSTVYIDEVTIDSSTTPTLYNVNLQSQQDTLATSNLGTINCNGVLYTLPGTSSEEADVYPVTYNAASGYTFNHWEATGLISITNPNAASTTITVSGTGTLKAIYTATAQTQYTLTVTVIGSGSVTKVPNQATYASGTSVQLTAVPAAGYQFSGWSGALTGTTNPATIIMDSNKAVTATFTIISSGHWFADDFETGNLAAWDGTDGGAATSTTSPHQGIYHLSSSLSSGANNVWAGAYKSITGTNPVYLSAYVRFNAPPNTDNEDQWALAFTQNTAGNALAYAGIRQVSGTLYWTIWYISTGTTLTYNVSSTAYTSGWHNLQLAVYRGTSNNGWVEFYVDGALVCSARNLDNDGRTLSYARVGFSYSDAPSAAATTLYIDEVTIDTSTTPPTEYTLTVNVSGSGSVTKNPNQATYTSGSTVQLTATPNTGYTFTGWSGDLTGTTNPATITMNSNKAVTATFVPIAPTQYTLTVNVVGSGSVTKNPNQASYTSGTTVQLTAVPATGYVFTGWSGDLSGAANPATITMNSNKTVTATFTLSSTSHLLEDTFETGTLALWDGTDGGASISTASPYQGTYHLSSSLSSGANNVWAGAYKSITGTNPVYLSAYVRFNAPPNTDNEDQWALAFTQNTAGNALAYAGIRQVNGTLYWAIWYYSGTSLVYQTSNIPYTGSWHSLELGINRGTANGWVELHVDGTLACSAYNLNNAGRTLSYARVGFSYSDAPSAAATTLYIDEVTIDS